MALIVKRLSEANFRAMANDWQRCLRASDANQLFMSWPWLYSWWETWSQIWGLELLLLGVFDESGDLVGIAPLYWRDLKTPVGVRVTRLHFLGNAWRIGPTVRTEYCRLILDKKREKEAREAILGYLQRENWDELILCDVTDEELARLRDASQDRLGKPAEVSRLHESGVYIDTTGRFADWLKGLGRNTRLKVYNRRHYLASQGEIALREVTDKTEFYATLEKLNNFHRLRWGKPAFDPDAIAFHQRLFSRLSEHGMTVAMSELKYCDNTVSILYDIVVAGTRFNLQSGYQENFDPKVSLGSLHLGYAIEKSFLATDVNTYDMLAGAGKKSFYKSRFNGVSVSFHTLQMVRSRWLKIAYEKQQRLPTSWRRVINRAFRL